MFHLIVWNFEPSNPARFTVWNNDDSKIYTIQKYWLVLQLKRIPGSKLTHPKQLLHQTKSDCKLGNFSYEDTNQDQEHSGKQNQNICLLRDS